MRPKKKKLVVQQSSDSALEHLDEKPVPLLPFQSLNAKRKEFRLFKLQDGADDHSMEYTMFRSSLEKPPRYDAISYSWGALPPPSSLKEIKIDGVVLHVRPTLYSILKILARKQPQLPLWTDFICIDQSNTSERNEQVSVMGDIYESAKAVHAWLGEGDADSDYVFDYVSGQKGDDDKTAREFQQSSELLFSRAYWKRMWVIQEFGLARHLFIVCGDKSTKWEKLAQSLAPVEKDKNAECWKQFNSFSKVRDLSFDRPLIDLVFDFREGRCQERHDMVYSLRSLANDASLIDVDYGQLIAEVFFQLLSICPPMALIKRFRPNDQAFETYTWGSPEASTWLYPTLRLSTRDMVGNLQDKPGDKLFLWTYRRGFVAHTRVTKGNDFGPFLSQKFQLRDQMLGGKKSDYYYTGDEVEEDDDGLALIPEQDKILLIVRPYGHGPGIVDIAISSEVQKMIHGNDQRMERLRVFRDSCLHDIQACFACTLLHRDTYGLFLWHISRAMLFQIHVIDQILEEQIQDDVLNAIVPEYGLPSSRDMDPMELCKCEEVELVCHQPQERNTSTYIIRETPEGYGMGSDREPKRRIYDRSLATKAHSLWRPPEDKPYVSPLFMAVENGDEDQVKLLVAQDGIDPNKKHSNGTTALAKAVGAGHTALVKVIAPQSNVKKNLGSGRRSELTMAAENGKCDMVEALLKTGKFDVNAKDGEGDTPLRIAVARGHLDVVEFLLEQKDVKLGACNSNGVSLLATAVVKNHDDIFRLLLEQEDIDINAGYRNGRTPLFYAVREGHVDIVEQLLRRKDIKVNSRNYAGMTELMQAANCGFADIVELLLANPDVKVNLTDTDGLTALEIANESNHRDVVQILLAHQNIDYDPKKGKRGIKGLIRKYKERVGEAEEESDVDSEAEEEEEDEDSTVSSSSANSSDDDDSASSSSEASGSTDDDDSLEDIDDDDKAPPSDRHNNRLFSRRRWSDDQVNEEEGEEDDDQGSSSQRQIDRLFSRRRLADNQSTDEDLPDDHGLSNDDPDLSDESPPPRSRFGINLNSRKFPFRPRRR